MDARLDAALEGLETGAMVWRHGDGFCRTDRRPFRRAAGRQTKRATSRSTDPALLIYTSGTTGLPKAAFVSHHRVMMWTHWFAGLMDARADDRLYNCLPMYHSASAAWWRPARCCWRAAR